VEREVSVIIHYKGEPLTRERIDMIVDGKVIIENKSMPTLAADATQQLFGYLCATTFEVGLLLHYAKKRRFYRVVCENRLKHHPPRSKHPRVNP